MKLLNVLIMITAVLFSNMAGAADSSTETFKKVVNKVVAAPFKSTALSLIQKETIKDVRIENGRAFIDIDTSAKYLEVTDSRLSTKADKVSLPQVITIPFPKQSDLVEPLTVIAEVVESYLASKDYQNLLEDMGIGLASESIEPSDLYIEVLKVSKTDNVSGLTHTVFVGAHFKPQSNSFSDGNFSAYSCIENACSGGSDAKVELRKK